MLSGVESSSSMIQNKNNNEQITVPMLISRRYFLLFGKHFFDWKTSEMPACPNPSSTTSINSNSNIAPWGSIYLLE